MPKTESERAIVTEFYRTLSGEYQLWAMTVVKEVTTARGEIYISRDIYDIELSRLYGYMFDQSGAGGSGPITVQGLYHVSGDVEIREQPTAIVHSRDNPPWRSRSTKMLRKLNRTRRLNQVLKEFRGAADILAWLQRNGIEEDSVYCSECRDTFPESSTCRHIWWCYKSAWWSTPSERCSHEGECCE